MKRTLLIVSTLMLLFTACNQDEDGYSLGDIWLSLGMLDTSKSLGYDFVVYCDNGDTLLPASNAVPYFDFSEYERILVNYTILDEAGESDKKFYVRINNLHPVLFKDVIELTPENTDSLGNDPVEITAQWIGGGFLNIEFRYFGTGSITHYINLAYERDTSGQINHPVELLMLHNDNNDSERHVLKGLVSFRLDSLLNDESSQLNYLIKATDFNGEEQSFTGTYNY